MDPNSTRPGVDLEYGGGGLPRRGALWIAGLGVTLITAAAFALSYDGLYAAALAGGVRSSLAFLYPMFFDGFLVLAFVAAVVLRSGGLRATWYPWFLIVVLLTAAAGANVLYAVGRESLLPPETMRVAVAAAPPVALGLAFPLWLLLVARARGGRQSRRADVRATTTNDIVPGLRSDDARAPATATEPAAPGAPAALEKPATAEARATAEEPAAVGDPTISAEPESTVEPTDAQTPEEPEDAADTGRRLLAGRPAVPPPITPPSSKVRSSPIPPDA